MKSIPLNQTRTKLASAPLGKQFQGWRACALTLGVLAGLAGGVLAGVLGSLLTAASWLTSQPIAKEQLATLGAVLLYLTVPLILLGAFCLDWCDGNTDSAGRADTTADNE